MSPTNKERRNRFSTLCRWLVIGGAFTIVPGFAGTSLAGDCGGWSDYPGCNRQFVNDRAICARVNTAACWQSSMDRLAYCNKTKGEVGTPRLRTK